MYSLSDYSPSQSPLPPAPICLQGAGRHVRRGGVRTTLRENGLSLGVDPGGERKPGERQVIRGWSKTSCKSNTRFLESICCDALLEGRAVYGCTFTVKECPALPLIWCEMRRRLIRRLERMGMKGYHWLTEWQARGVPHLHFTVFFDADDDPGSQAIAGAWLAVGRELGALPAAQCVKPMRIKCENWMRYLVKHGSRGFYNYQRSPKNIPKKWKGLTRRMWGRGGKWLLFSLRLDLEFKDWVILRRRMHALWKANTRGEAMRAERKARWLSAKGKKQAAAKWKARADAVYAKLGKVRKLLQAETMNKSMTRGLSGWCDGRALLRGLAVGY